MSDEVRLIDANGLIERFNDIGAKSASGQMQLIPIKHIKHIIDNAPTIVSDEAIVLDFTNITEEQKQQLVNLLSKTKIQAINQDVIWQNGYYACLNDKSIRESNWIPVSEKLPYNMEDILVTIQVNNREPKVRSGFYAYGIFNAANGDTWSWNDPEVKAWMPLPEPYKEAENDNS